MIMSTQSTVTMSSLVRMRRWQSRITQWVGLNHTHGTKQTLQQLTILLVPLAKIIEDLKIFENKTQKLVSICSKLNATCYISGISGHDYLDENLFGEQKIKLIYENFIHPKYNQIHGDFIENMSIIDLVMNQGDTSMKILLDSKNIP